MARRTRPGLTAAEINELRRTPAERDAAKAEIKRWTEEEREARRERHREAIRTGVHVPEPDRQSKPPAPLAVVAHGKSDQVTDQIKDTY